MRRRAAHPLTLARRVLRIDPPDDARPSAEAFHADPVAGVRERYAEVRGSSLPGRTPTGTVRRRPQSGGASPPLSTHAAGRAAPSAT